MLLIQTKNSSGTQVLEHPSGPLELGRGPKANDTPRFMISDPYVSKNHVRVQELDSGLLQIANLSAKQPVEFSFYAPLAAGENSPYAMPVQFRPGQTEVAIEPVLDDSAEIKALETVAAPFALQHEGSSTDSGRIGKNAMESP